MIKINIIGTLILFLLTSTILPDDIRIKSLKSYQGNDETSFPVLTHESERDSLLTIEFDVAAQSEPKLNIVFRFCDKNWNPYESLFLANNGFNTAYYLDFDFLPTSVKGAKYHYRGTFPNQDDRVTFPFSGKYIFYITDADNDEIIYGWGKFVVIRNTINIKTKLTRETIMDKIYYPADLARIFKIEVDFNLPEHLFPSYVDDVEIIENQKTDFPYIISKDNNTELSYFNWDANRHFTFTTRETRPGNEYRQTDLRNTNVYIGENVNAHFGDIETSRFFVLGSNDLNGGSVLTKYKDDYADYLNVNFRLKPPEELNKRIFVTGAFSDWMILPENELINENGIWNCAVNMKRGKYDYQYVTADFDDVGPYNIDWHILEGNNWETKNNYYIFVFYSEQEKGGYDRIIGYNKIISK